MWLSVTRAKIDKHLHKPTVTAQIMPRRELCEYLPNDTLAISLNNLAALYESQGRWVEAEPLLERVLAIHEELYGYLPNDDLVARLNNLAFRRLGCTHRLTHIYDRESGEVVPSSCPLSAAPYTIESIDGCTCLRVTPSDFWQCEYAIDYAGYAVAKEFVPKTIYSMDMWSQLWRSSQVVFSY